MARIKKLSLFFNHRLFWLILISTCVRLFFAAFFEFSNDEVYYWLYAKYPSLSHFDHPPMIGWIMQITTLNLHFNSELFIRLGAVLMSAINTYTIFAIGKHVKDENTGFIAALLYSTSIYTSVMAGAFIIPDSPQLFFLLLALNQFIKGFKSDYNMAWTNLTLGGLFSAMAICSKYHAVFILIGIALYVLFIDRKWLKHPALYISLIIGIMGLLPTLIWNMQNGFASFAFHSNRVVPDYRIRFDYFFTEIGGELGYQNPINFILIWWSVIAFFRLPKASRTNMQWYLILNGLPLIAVFVGFSFFRSTLPHWTGPGYIPLIIFAALFLDSRLNEENDVPIPVKYSIALISILATGFFYVVNFAPFQFGKTNPANELGKYDFTLDMHGWKQIADRFEVIKEERKLNDYDFIGQKWFPATHVFYYISQPHNANMYLIGDLKSIHKYAWINKTEGGLKKSGSYYHICTSNYYHDPNEAFGEYFNQIIPLDTIEVFRGKKKVREAYLYELSGYNGKFKNPKP